MHGLGRERLAVAAARAQPDHFLFAIDHLEGQIRPDLHPYHVDRVGAEVDGGYSHMSTIITVSRIP